MDEKENEPRETTLETNEQTETGEQERCRGIQRSQEQQEEKEGEAEEREEKENARKPDTLEQLLENWMDENNHKTQEKHEPMETNYKGTTPNRFTEQRTKQTYKMAPEETQNRQRKDGETLNTRETSQKETSPQKTSPRETRKMAPIRKQQCWEKLGLVEDNENKQMGMPNR